MARSVIFNPFTGNFDEISEVTLAAVGSTPSANAASIASDQTLTLQPADGTHPGVITSGTQTLGGNKTFTGSISASNLSGTNTGDVTLAAVGASPNANAASLSGQVLNLQPFDGTHPGVVAASGGGTANFLRADGTWALPSGTGINQLTGDATAGPGTGSQAITLATVNTNVGSFGDASHVGGFTVNGKGLITAASSTSIQIAESQVTNLVSDLAGKLSTALTSAHIFVGNGSNVATDTAVTGDVTITNAGVTAIGNNKVTNALIRQSAALSVVGNSTNATANVADIAAASDNQILRRSGTSIGFGSIDLSQSNAVGATILGAANGGTGAATLTAHSVLIGNGTGAVAFAGPSSTAGFVLTSNGASADPTFQAVTATAPNSHVYANTGSGYGSTNTKIRRISGTPTTVGTDITFADSAANGSSFTINTTGVYSMTYTDGKSSGTGAQIGISVNSAQLTTNVFNITAANRLAYMDSAVTNGWSSISVTVFLSSGDVVRPHGDGSCNLDVIQTVFSITRVA